VLVQKLLQLGLGGLHQAQAARERILKLDGAAHGPWLVGLGLGGVGWGWVGWIGLVESRAVPRTHQDSLVGQRRHLIPHAQESRNLINGLILAAANSNVMSSDAVGATVAGGARFLILV